MEEEEARDEHEEGQCTEGDGKVAPALVVGTVTTVRIGRSNMARNEVRVAGVVGDEAPSN